MLSAISTFAVMLKCIVAILDPRPGHLKSSAADVEAVLQYKGDELGMQVLQNQINPDREGNAWIPFLDDFLSKGAATVSLYPEVEKLVGELKTIAGSGDLLRSEVFALVSQALERRAFFVKEMRSGLLKVFDTELRDLAVAIEAAIGADDIQILKKAFLLFMSVATVSKAATNLDRWVKSNQQKIKEGGFHQFMNTFPESFTLADGDVKPKLEVSRLLLVAKAVDTSSDAELDKKLMRAVAWHLRLFLELFEAIPLPTIVTLVKSSLTCWLASG